MNPHSEMLDEIPQLGEVIADKYRLERVLGIGGMGVVCEASHVHLGEKFAIKFLAGEAARSEERVARFLREAWAAAKIKSEHVVRVVDVGRRNDGIAYMVMEFLEGEDVEEVLRRGPLIQHEAIDFVLQACEALAEAHRLGIVHRDLKPGNLFVTTRADGLPWIKVLDFGISKVAGGALTNTSTLMGSPLYMSPQQLTSSKHVDHRSDIWALGVILYEMLSGATPFTAETLPQIVAAVMHASPRPLEGSSRALAPQVVQALYRCLEKDPDKRFQSLAELAVVLAPFGGRSAQASAEYIANVASRDPNAPRAPLDSHVSVAQLAQNPTVASQPQLTVQGSPGEPMPEPLTDHQAAPARTVASSPGTMPGLPSHPGGGVSTHEPVSALRVQPKQRPLAAIVAVAALALVTLIAVVAFVSGERTATLDADDSPAIAAAPAATGGGGGDASADAPGAEPSATVSASAATSASANATASADASRVAPKPPAPHRGGNPPKKWDPWEGR